MSRACKIEAHPQKKKILKALLEGQSTHQISAWAKPKISAMSVQRYKAQVVTPAVERSGNRVANLHKVKAQAPVTIQPDLLRDSLRAVQDAPVLALRDARLRMLQGLADRLQIVMDERAAAHAEAPGGSSGLLAKDFRGTGENMMPVYAVDGVVLREARELSKQIAQELGQWIEKSDVSLKAEVSSVSVVLAKHCTIEQLEAMCRDGLAQAEQQKQLAAGPVVEVTSSVVEKQEVPDASH